MEEKGVMKGCMVLLSGGQDSCTCLAWALERFAPVYTVSFDYGQRHKVELLYSKLLSILAKAKEHFVVPVSSLEYLKGSALLEHEKSVSERHPLDSNLPSSFVPGRNYLFLGLAAALALQVGVDDLVVGVCQTDFSGYPDCRDNAIKSIQVSLSLSLGRDIVIHTPLMWKTKAETVLMMKEMEKLDWYFYTQTCYEGRRPPCGECPACRLRVKGFEEAGVLDPLVAGGQCE